MSEERSVVHVIERYKANAVFSHFDNSFAPFAEQVLALVQVAGVAVYGHPTPETRERLESFGAVFMESLDGFTRH